MFAQWLYEFYRLSFLCLTCFLQRTRLGKHFNSPKDRNGFALVVSSPSDELRHTSFLLKNQREAIVYDWMILFPIIWMKTHFLDERLQIYPWTQ